MLCYVVWRARPPRLHSSLQHVQRFRTASKMTGESGYYVATLMAVVDFLTNATASSFGMDPDDFARYLCRLPPPPGARRGKRGRRRGLIGCGGRGADARSAVRPSADMSRRAKLRTTRRTRLGRPPRPSWRRHRRRPCVPALPKQRRHRIAPVPMTTARTVRSQRPRSRPAARTARLMCCPRAFSYPSWRRRSRPRYGSGRRGDRRRPPGRRSRHGRR